MFAECKPQHGRTEKKGERSGCTVQGVCELSITTLSHIDAWYPREPCWSPEGIVCILLPKETLQQMFLICDPLLEELPSLHFIKAECDKAEYDSVLPGSADE